MNQGGDTGQRRSRQPSSQSNFSAPQSTNERRGRQWQNQSDGRFKILVIITIDQYC
jgi:hypothetical protein